MATLIACTAFGCRAERAQPQSQQSSSRSTTKPLPSRRQLLGGLAATAATAATLPRPAFATGLESIDLPQLDIPQALVEKKARNQAIIDNAEKSFQESGAPLDDGAC
jgi:hypothetical protein